MVVVLFLVVLRIFFVCVVVVFFRLVVLCFIVLILFGELGECMFELFRLVVFLFFDIGVFFCGLIGGIGFFCLDFGWVLVIFFVLDGFMV